METQNWFNNFVCWCNVNTGFLTVLLTFATLMGNAIALVVSIHTSRIPYKKQLVLSKSFDFVFSKAANDDKVKSDICGLSVNAANTGSRNINLTYLGLSFKDKPLCRRTKQITKLLDRVTGTGIIAPTEVKTEMFKANDLIAVLSDLDPKAVLYLCAKDTEGKEYSRKLGSVAQLQKALSSY